MNSNKRYLLFFVVFVAGEKSNTFLEEMFLAEKVFDLINYVLHSSCGWERVMKIKFLFRFIPLSHVLLQEF